MVLLWYYYYYYYGIIIPIVYTFVGNYLRFKCNLKVFHALKDVKKI